MDREHDGDACVDLLVGLDLRQATERELRVLGVEELEDVAPDSLFGRQAHEPGRGPARVVDDPGPIDEHERHGGAIDEMAEDMVGQAAPGGHAGSQAPLGMIACAMTLTSDVATTTTIPETHTDLLSASTAILGTVGPDGRPQLSAVWFVADGDELKVSLNSTRQKTKNLRANPAVNLFILDVENPQRYLEVRGDAEIADDPDRAFAGGPVSEK